MLLANKFQGFKLPGPSVEYQPYKQTGAGERTSIVVSPEKPLR